MPGTPSSLYSSVRLVLTPATLVWSPLFAGYYAYLAGSISFLRLKTNHSVESLVKSRAHDVADSVGEGDDAIHGPGTNATPSTHDVKKLRVAVRAHANFAESVPFTVLLVTLAELNGAPSYLVHLAYGALLSLRIAHNELGLKMPQTAGLGRVLGHNGNVLLGILAGVYNFTLGWDSLKSFLGQ